MKQIFALLLALAIVPASAGDPPASAATRTFRMGFTGFVPALTLEGMSSTTAFCRRHGDLIAHHIEGAAWAELHASKPLPDKLLRGWNDKRGRKPEHGKVCLALSPGRGDLKIADDCAPLPEELKFRSYSDPAVIQAYIAWCSKAVEFFKPDWLVIGIEMNEVMTSNTAAWNAYLKLHEETRAALKKTHPDLPVAASFSLHNLYKGGETSLKEWRKLDSGNDFIAVSYYPFLSPHRTKPVEWLLTHCGDEKKPIAFVETGDAAEVLPLPKSKVTIDGSPEKQRDYFDYLLTQADRRRFSFVVSFIHQDYDSLWEVIAPSAPEIFMAWRDCGLIDEKGKERPALKVWDQWLARKTRD